MSRLAVWLLAGAAAALAVTIGLEMRPPAKEADLVVAAAPGAPASQAGQAPPLPAGRQSEWVAAILARPLFSPDRRPPSASSGPVAVAAAPVLPRIAGILVDGGRRSVIFAGEGSGRPVVVAEGAEMNGFRVQAIEPGQVTVLGPDGARVLHPAFDPHPPAPQVVAPAVPPGLAGLPGLPQLQNPTGIPGLTAPNLPVPTAR